MSSWSSSYPPPPRSSRSRSPRQYGAARPPYPDSYDSFRQDWEYDRDKQWYPPYDYGSRRGRSRSPPIDEPGRKRRRSMSPYDRDRYDPRPRYDDYDPHSRYGYTSPRRQNYGPARRPPQDPYTFDYPASLKQYADWFRYQYPSQATEEDNADKLAEHEAGDGSKPRNGIKTRWEKYKKEFAATQLQTMFDHHRKSPWFAEKYDPAPEMENLRMRVRKEGWRGRMSTFLDDLETGKYDPDLNKPVPVEQEPPSSAKEKENGAASGSTEAPANTETNGEDKPEEELEVDEEGGNEPNGKSSERKLGKPEEEVSVLPEDNQVMIRTIPPDIGRVRLEDACSKVPGYIYLALGDPMQKRNYYRAGWLRFQGDADMSTVLTDLSDKKIEGFKLHLTHNTRPFVGKVRYAPEVASRPERLEKDLENVKRLAGILEDKAAKLRALKFPSSKPAPAPAPVEKANGEAAGASSNGNGAAAESNGDVKMSVHFEDAEEEEEPEPKESGCVALERRIEKVMSDMQEQGLVDVNDEKAYNAEKTVVSLDMYLAYLRFSFHTCYYCAVTTDHLEELQRKCLKHARKPLSKLLIEEIKAAEAAEKEKEKVKEQDEKEKDSDAAVAVEGVDKDKEMVGVEGATADAPTTTEDKNKVKEKGTGRADGGRDWKRNDERWLEWLDSKIALLINRDGVDPRDYGGKSYEEELTKAVEPYVKQEDEGKFRCKTCQKLFKATSFVEKHIANKHPELVKSLDEVPYFNNFALDPHRIQPFAHPPPATGNNQAPPQAYGIQASHQGGDYGRGGPGYYGGGSNYPPQGYGQYNNGWDQYGGGGGGYGQYPQRRDDRRLSDRITGYAGPDGMMPHGVGLPPKPPTMDGALQSGNGPSRRNTGNGRGMGGGPPPPPPPDAKEDPRAAAGKRISYHDMDLVAEGDVELMY